MNLIKEESRYKLSKDLLGWAKYYKINVTAYRELLGMLHTNDPFKIQENNLEKGISESTVQKQIKLKTNQTNGILLRNNSGVAREPTISGDIRYVRYGLGNTSKKLNSKFKSSDLIGITPLTIQKRHVGGTWGVFTAIETKNSKWKGPKTKEELAQQYFIDVIRSKGGIASFAIVPNDYDTSIAEFYHITSLYNGGIL